MGLFYRFLEEESVKLIGVEAGGHGVEKLGGHASRFNGGKTGIVQGYKTMFLQDEQGNLAPTHSISAGLDYPGVGPQFAYLQKEGRVTFEYATDAEVIAAFKELARTEGILPAMESSHAVAYALKFVPTLSKDQIVVVNISGRADKDIFIVAEGMKDKEWVDFIHSKHEQYE
jgi:tryptophan synthase beta chain